MTEIFPGRHLRLVEQIAAGPHYALQQLRDADLPLTRIMISLYVQRHLLGHVFDDLGGDHHVTAVQTAAVVGHLRELSADAQDHVALRHAILQRGQPDRPTLAQVWRIAMPKGRLTAGEASPSG